MKPVTIDGETADRITALTLAQHRDWMVEYVVNSRHKISEAELERYTNLIKSSNTLLEQYYEVPVL
jgi:hypothetical protein